MKIVYYLLILSSISISVSAQQQDYNRFTIEPSFGFNSVSKPFSPGYSMKTLNAFSANGTMRYMFSRMLGMSFEFGMNRFKSDVENFAFESKHLRASAQFVFNASQALKFTKKTNHIGLLVHGGFGFSSLNDDSYNIGEVVDNMSHVVVGITPQFKLNERLALNLDYSFYGYMLQNRTFDLKTAVPEGGINGIQSHLTLGLMIVLGDKSRHSDWHENK